MAVPVGGVEWRYDVEVDVFGVVVVVVAVAVAVVDIRVRSPSSSKAGVEAAATSMDRSNMGDLVTSPIPINGDPNAADVPPINDDPINDDPINDDDADDPPINDADETAGERDTAGDAEGVSVAAGSLGMGEPGTSNDDRASRNHFAAGD